MSLRTLTDDEMLRVADATDSVLRSDIEMELGRRLDAALERLADLQPLAELIENFNLTTDELCQMVQLAADRDAADIKGLTDKLDRADAWYDLAVEAGDLFARLETLRAKTT
mgnify:CR=1 FL=1